MIQLSHCHWDKKLLSQGLGEDMQRGLIYWGGGVPADMMFEEVILEPNQSPEHILPIPEWVA